MREIKFRGKSIHTGRWAYGYLSVDFEESSSPHYSIKIGPHGFVTVCPKSVGQFTGLKDSKGVEIFEGDVVEHSFNTGAKDMPVVVRYKLDKFVNARPYRSMEHGLSVVNVLGNIYENPELIKAPS